MSPNVVRLLRAVPGTVIAIIALSEAGDAIRRFQGFFAALTPDEVRTSAVILGVALALLGLFWDRLRPSRSREDPPPRAQSGKKGTRKVAPYRLAVDTLVTWIYRRKEWAGLSADGKYREPAPKAVGADLYRALGIPGVYEPVGNIIPEPGFEGPPVEKKAEEGGSGRDSVLGMSGDLETRVVPGPGSPTLDQVSFESKGRRHFAYGNFGRRPKAVRFSKPEDRLLRSVDLPFEMPCGRGRIVVEKFYDEGIVIDEDGTIGDSVAFVAYFDD